jgi:uncharacterized protein (DUF1919 family)
MRLYIMVHHKRHRTRKRTRKINSRKINSRKRTRKRTRKRNSRKRTNRRSKKKTKGRSYRTPETPSYLEKNYNSIFDKCEKEVYQELKGDRTDSQLNMSRLTQQAKEICDKRMEDILTQSAEEHKKQKGSSSKGICIVSNNCYGTKYYHKNKLQYNSPFIGIFIYSECYIKLLENFSKYMKKIPKSCSRSKYGDKKYPVLTIGDIEVHCLHDKDVKECIGKWQRRKKRMLSLNQCHIKMCDHDRYVDDFGRRFSKLKYKNKKLFLSKKNYFDHSCTIKTKYKNRCPDGYALGKDYPIEKYLR